MAKNEMELTDALNQSAGNSSQPDVEPSPVSNRRASREGTRLIGGHFDREVHRQLKLMSLEEDCSIQSLLGEALNYLFSNRGKPQIALPNKKAK